jgi:hypothetical protein
MATFATASKQACGVRHQEIAHRVAELRAEFAAGSREILRLKRDFVAPTLQSSAKSLLPRGSL